MKPEAALHDWLSSQESRLLDLLEALVTTESHAANPAGVERAAGLVSDELAPLGFEFEASPSPSLPPEDHWLEDLFSPGVPYENLGHTYAASSTGTSPGRLLLLGDLDTAFPTGTLDSVPYRIVDGKAFGPGIADMKGGLVVLIAALQAIDQLGLKRPDATVVLAGDEQAGSLGSRPVIEREGIGADWCLCVECARRGGKLMVARGHIGVGTLTVSGREAHTGSARAEGINALEALAHLVLQLNALTDPPAGTLVTVTIASAGRRRSIVPATAIATVDIRTRSPGAWEAVTTQMDSVVAEVGERTGTVIDLRTYNHRPGVARNQATDALLQLARSVGSELSIELDVFESAAAGSTAFRPPDTPTLDGLGPLGSGLMTTEEHIEIDSLAPRAALLAGLISRLTASPDPN
ncbi:MAG: M20/M25/M40 family metallo-hydrolase [Acidimicrobiia bacterium]|nr:M20/M25/M40 family metallo-hydrolase [Acidimicrobiia bacterium]